MKKRILVLSGLLGFGVLFGCSQVSNDVSADSPKMFVRVSNEGIFTVYKHKETNCLYTVSDSSYNYGNLTQLLNKDGLPYCEE